MDIFVQVEYLCLKTRKFYEKRFDHLSRCVFVSRESLFQVLDGTQLGREPFHGFQGLFFVFSSLDPFSFSESSGHLIFSNWDLVSEGYDDKR